MISEGGRGGEPFVPAVRLRGVTDDSELEAWLARDYATAYRTACLVLRDPHDAQDAVQEAFLRVFRFRDAIPAGEGRNAVQLEAFVQRLRPT